MPSIEAISLRKKYGAFVALSSLNLKIEGTKCVGFLGPNGSGKTTTLKMFTDLITPTSGQALINGVDVHVQKRQALTNVSSLIETPEIYAALTPREALTMVAEIRGVPKAERKRRVEDAVAEVRMEDWIDKRVGKFSKGMKQRIAIASTLVSNPAIIILDEPTTGLDPRGMSEIRGIIKSLKSKDHLIFMSSHILSEVADVCDEVALINRGNLIIHDTIGNVTAKFAGGKNVVEIGFCYPIPERLANEVIPGFSHVTETQRIDKQNLRVKFTGGLEGQELLLRKIVDLNAGVVSYKPAASELEDAYLKLITNTV